MRGFRFLLAVAGVVGMVAVAVLASSLPTVRRWYASQTWDQRVCTIAYANVSAIGYTVAIDGRTYPGHRLRFNAADTFEAAEVDRVRAGEVLPCWANPDAPYDSVLFREADTATLIAFIGSLHLLVVVTAVVTILGARRAKLSVPTS